MILKRLAKYFTIFILYILSFFLLFVLTLQVFEYTPADEIPLTIDSSELLTEQAIELDTLIKVMTFNIGYASLSATEDFAMDGGTKGRMDSLAEVEANLSGIHQILNDYPMDIYLLQEVDQGSDRSYQTKQVSFFQNQIGFHSTYAYNYRSIFVPFPLNPRQMMGQVNSGVLSLFQSHILEAKRIQLPGAFDWPLRLANLKRCIVVHRLPIANSTKQLIVINVHLSAYDDGSMRLQEMAKLQEIMLIESQLDNYVVVGGDFNQSFPGSFTKTVSTLDNSITYQYSPFELKQPDFWQAFGLDDLWFMEHGFQFGVMENFALPTCRLLHQAYDKENPENNQYYYIDGFIVSANVQIENVEVINQNFEYSDHNPVVMSFKLLP